jgi:hypothetical protein
MSSQTITEFLLERIGEDEAAAKGAAEMMSGESWINDATCVTSREDTFWVDGLLVRSPELVAEHIVRHDPTRVLAECAAKRAIIEQHKDWPVLVEKEPEFTEDATDPQNIAYRVTQEMVWLTEREYVKRFGTEAPTTNMIRAIAAVYKDHPDYQQEWAL